MHSLPLHATCAPLRPFAGQFDVSAVISESRKVWRLIGRSPHWSDIRRRITAFSIHLSSASTNLSENALQAFPAGDFDYPALAALCQSLISWRTGPYQIGSFHLDTEWRSNMKWSRIAPLLPSRPGMRIADVGCSNGYFLFKLSTLNPEIAVGFDPIERCWLQFALLQSILQVPNTAFLPMGILSLDAFTKFFDLIVCMGVIYHQRDQALAVKRLYDATRPGGQVLLESLVVPGDNSLVVSPPDRYAKMRNAWCIPSAHSLGELFKNAGFKDVSVHSFGPLSTAEQRSTPLAPFESLADFLDPADPSRTVEGHQAPHTAAVTGRR